MVPDRPDLGDYASYDLALLRQEYCNDQYSYAVTRAQAKGDQKPFKIPVHYRQKVREAKPQGAVRMSARLKKRISHEIVEPPVVLPKQVDNPIKQNKARSVRITEDLQMSSDESWIREQNADLVIQWVKWLLDESSEKPE